MSDQELLGKTKRGSDGFASTGVHVIQKAKKEDKIELTTSESEQATAQNSCKMLEIVCEKSKDDLQISSEEAIMTVNKEVVVHESITIDEQFF